MFEKSVTDLIRDIRSKKFTISQTLSEIQNEITKPELRGNAIQKCCVLHLLGYDMNWISFHVVELMSSNKPIDKRTGYLAASLLFNQDTPVLMLCTNLMKKDLTSNNVSDCAMALHTLAAIANADLSRDLLQDILLILNHSNPYIRKRCVVVLMLEQSYPEAISTAFPRLKEKLEDEDRSVITATVSVLCELISASPKEYLPLVPQLYHLLNSSNNWLQLKVIKAFALLCPHEPRLVKKLSGPLKSILLQSKSISVIYEIIYTIISGGLVKESEEEVDDLGVLCLEKLLNFLDQADQNLKFLGLNALAKLLIIRPNTGSKHREVILKCLEDGDISIRTLALDLIPTLVNPKSLFGIVKRLVVHLTSSSAGSSFSRGEMQYRSKVASTIMHECSKNNYAYVTNFEWYVAVLCDLALVQGFLSVTGKLLGEQLLDICVRVTEVREFAKEMLVLPSILETANNPENNCDILYAAGWICGEYAKEHFAELSAAFISPKIRILSTTIQAVYLFAFLKIYSKSQEGFQIEAQELACFVNSTNLQVQDRACLILAILDEHRRNGNCSAPNPWEERLTWTKYHISSCFDGSLNMVAPLAQANLPVTLDLQSWLVPLNPQDAQLLESPARDENVTSVESLLTELAIQAEKQEEKENEEKKIIGLQSISLGSSVLCRPEAKNYNVNFVFDGEELVQNNPISPNFKEKEIDSSKAKEKQKKHSRTKLLPAKLDPQEFVLYTRDELILTGSFTHILRDPLALNIQFDLSISVTPSLPFALEMSEHIKSQSGVLPITLSRTGTTDYFPARIHFNLILDLETIEVSAALPFSVNILSPKAHKMTQDKFLEIVLRPPHPLNSKLVWNGAYGLKDAANLISKKLLCAFQLLENAASLFSMTIKQTVIVGLIKSKDGGVIVELKTFKDDAVIDWITDCMKSLGFSESEFTQQN